MADWSQGYIAVDWGTTNRRAYLLSPSGERRADFEDDLGVTAIEPGVHVGWTFSIADALGGITEPELLPSP